MSITGLASRGNNLHVKKKSMMPSLCIQEYIDDRGKICAFTESSQFISFWDIDS